MSVEKGLQWGVLSGGAALLLWDFESVQATYRRQSELARNAGALAPLCFNLVGEAYVMTWRGDLASAAALADELAALRTELSVVTRQRDILKKALGILDQDQSNVTI